MLLKIQITDSNGEPKPGELKRLRGVAQCTQKELAKRAGVSVDIIIEMENPSKARKNPLPKKRHSGTVLAIEGALAELITEAKLKQPSVSSKLLGEWWSYHFTINDLRLRAIKVCRWRIANLQDCVVTQEFEEDVSAGRPGTLKRINKRPPLVYQGIGNIEEGHRLVFTLDIHTSEIEERAVWRFPYELPLTSDIAILRGRWFGTDHWKKDRGSAAILSREPLHEKKGRTTSIQLQPIVRAELTKVEDCWINPQLAITGSAHWDPEQLHTAIRNCKQGTEITAITSFFPEGISLTRALKEIETDDVTVRILLFNPYSLRRLIEARCEHLQDPKYRSHLSPRQLQNRIKEQAKHFLEVGKELKHKVEIKVCFFESWSFGMSFQIGNEAMFFGLILASALSVDGPMFTLDGKSESWEILASDLNEVWKGAKDAHKLLKEHHEA